MSETSDAQTNASQETSADPVVVIGEKTDSPQEITLPSTVSRPEQRLLLIDGHSLAFRAFFALSRAAEYGNGPAFVTSEGVHTEGVYGFVNTMVKLIRDYQPTHLIVSFDLEGPTLRSQEYGDYKAAATRLPRSSTARSPISNASSRPSGFRSSRSRVTRPTTFWPPWPRAAPRRTSRFSSSPVTATRSRWSTTT